MEKTIKIETQKYNLGKKNKIKSEQMYTMGYDTGYDQGYESGFRNGVQNGRKEAFSEGFKKGLKRGYLRGIEDRDCGEGNQDEFDDDSIYDNFDDCAY